MLIYLEIFLVQTVDIDQALFISYRFGIFIKKIHMVQIIVGAFV